MKENSNDHVRNSKSNRNIYIWLYSLTALLFVLTVFCLYNWYKISGGNLKLEFKSDGTYLTVLIGVAGFLAAFSAISIYSIFNASVDKEKERIDKLRIDFDSNIDKEKEKIEKLRSEFNLNADKEKVRIEKLHSDFSALINKEQEKIEKLHIDFKTNIDIERETIEKLRLYCESKIHESTVQLDIKFNENKTRIENSLGDSNIELSKLLNNIKTLIDLTSPYSTSLKKREAIKHFTVLPSVNTETIEFIYNFFVSLEPGEKGERYYNELEELLFQWGKISKEIS